MPSFDIVSQVDAQEVRNAVEQANKEIGNRYDFKGSDARIEQKDAAIYTWIQTREEITKLLVECPKGIREIVTLAVGTGMRLDELVHLQWADIDLDRRLIAVHRGRHGTTKSGKARTRNATATACFGSQASS